jgi:hypothetical protein
MFWWSVVVVELAITVVVVVRVVAFRVKREWLCLARSMWWWVQVVPVVLQMQTV